MIKGYKHSLASREKMRRSHLGVKLSPSHRENLRKAHIGLRRSEEFREKMRQIMQGRNNRPAGFKHKPETIEKMRQAKLGKKLSLETRMKLSAARLGKPNPGGGFKKGHIPWCKGIHFKNPKISKSLRGRVGAASRNWKGGRTPIGKIIRSSNQYKEWRTAIFERDGYQCVIGGIAHGKDLQADHIKRFADFPELRFEISNGRTLCKPCHRKTPTYGSKKLP